MYIKKPWLHYSTISVIFVISLLYSIPNFFQDTPAVSITAPKGQILNLVKIKEVFKQFGYSSLDGHCVEKNKNQLLCSMKTVDFQMQAKDKLEKVLPTDYSVGLSLEPTTPLWLQRMGFYPMKLGLDLQGGVHLLLSVDTSSVLKVNNKSNYKELLFALKRESFNYESVKIDEKNQLVLSFDNDQEAKSASENIEQNHPNYVGLVNGKDILISNNTKINEFKNTYLMQKTIEAVQKRVNELGLSEAIVQKQGDSNISIDLPGIQDINKAKSILGNTATLSFQLVNYKDNPSELNLNSPSATSELVSDKFGNKLLLYKKSILSGDAITYATAGSHEGKPVVQIQLGGGGEDSFHQATRENIGSQLAIVFIKNNLDKVTNKRIVTKQIISAPNIKQPLHNSFVIEGMSSYEESDTLALLLRSGSLAAPVDIVEEMTIGPSLGAENINKGLFSITTGFVLIIMFMLVYYRTFGVIAIVALFFNLIMILCLLSLLEATLTLPAMAAIVLTVGMAVDANVLINERIREELRKGTSAKQSLDAGYKKAFATILDANVTTLIVSLVLYGLSSGMIKGFAVTLIIGILASMFTSVYVTRIISWSIFSRISNLEKSIGM